ncbi:MAG: hypothetical protein K0U36_00400, partial [Alphaproteobacteria bacterium]|nr:hypothetical protein [Alphaproteobacteria bacterium]
MAEDTNEPPKPLSEKVIQLKLAMRKKNRFLQLAYEADDSTTNMLASAKLVSDLVLNKRSGVDDNTLLSEFNEYCRKENIFPGVNCQGDNLPKGFYIRKRVLKESSKEETGRAIDLKSYLDTIKRLEEVFNHRNTPHIEDQNTVDQNGASKKEILDQKRQAFCL